jgi:DNA-binding beta-propeller fold protein YncE
MLSQKIIGASAANKSWDVSTAAFVKNFSVSVLEPNPYGLFFKSDGTKMYVVGQTHDTVYEYALSTAWDIGTASSLSTNFSVAGQEPSPTSLFFKDDGTRMYVLGQTGRAVNEYSLSTAWNVSTASYVRNFSVSAQDTIPRGLYISPDGTRMYVVGDAGNDVNQYSLSTAWNVSTSSYVRNFAISDVNPAGIFFKSDGTRMFVVGSHDYDVMQYELGTAWDISTASFTQEISVSSQDTGMNDIYFRGDGLQMFLVGRSNDRVYAYDIG